MILTAEHINTQARNLSENIRRIQMKKGKVLIISIVGAGLHTYLYTLIMVIELEKICNNYNHNNRVKLQNSSCKKYAVGCYLAGAAFKKGRNRCFCGAFVNLFLIK